NSVRPQGPRDLQTEICPHRSACRNDCGSRGARAGDFEDFPSRGRAGRGALLEYRAAELMKINAVLIAALLSISTFAAPQQAQNAPLLEKARQAYVSAQALEASLDERPENDRSRDEYLKVINAYQR